MKRLFIVVFLLVIGIFVANKIIKEQYLDRYNELNYRKSRLIYSQVFVDYFYGNFECPINIEELMEFAEGKPMYISALNSFRDPFLSDKGRVQYIPLYNRNNQRREGYIIFSSGIDRELNNSLIIDDTVYFDQLNKNCFYNSTNWKPNEITMSIDSDYKLADRILGRKDLLLEYLDCSELYKRNVRNHYTIDELVDTIYQYDVSREGRILGIKGVISEFTSSFDDKYKKIIMSSGNTRIEFKLYDKKGFKGEVGDSVALVGTLSDVIPSQNLIRFENSVQIDLNSK